MRVWYITNLPAPYTVEFFDELGKRCSLSVIYERKSASDRDLKWKANDKQKNYIEFYLKGKNVGGENSFGFGLIKFFKKNYKTDTPDAIVFGDYSTYTSIIGIEYLKLHHIPYVISTDGGFPNYEESSIKRKLKKRLIGGASWWFSSGGKTNSYLEYYGAKSERITQYPFTSLAETDILNELPDEEEKSSVRSNLGMSNGKVIVGVGQFIERKGWDILVRAFEEVNEEGSDVSLYIIGGKTGDLENLIGKEIPNGIFAIPFMSKRELFQYYRAADLFVLPTREDIWGLVVNEAMAMGLPVITTDRCNAGIELVKNGVNGFVVEAGDEKALKNVMSKILKTENERIKEMGQMSLHIISGYTHEKMVQCYMDGLEKYTCRGGNV